MRESAVATRSRATMLESARAIKAETPKNVQVRTILIVGFIFIGAIGLLLYLVR